MDSKDDQINPAQFTARVYVLQKLCILERAIDVLICEHFCEKNKHEEFANMILCSGALSFSSKKNIAAHILSETHRISKKSIKELLGDFITYRNLFAHEISEKGNDGTDKLIRLVSFKHANSVETYNIDKLNQLAQTIQKATELIYSMRKSNDTPSV